MHHNNGRNFPFCKNFLKKPRSKEVLAFHKIKFGNFC